MTSSLIIILTGLAALIGTIFGLQLHRKTIQHPIGVILEAVKTLVHYNKTIPPTEKDIITKRLKEIKQGGISG